MSLLRVPASGAGLTVVAVACVGLASARTAAQPCPPPEWSSLGIESQAGIFSVASSAGGELYASARFRNAAGVDTHDVARWNGTSWSAVGTDLLGPVRVIAPLSNGQLLVGGSFNFTAPGSITANNIVRWDGATWQRVGFGTSGEVRAIKQLSGGDFVIAGSFSGVWNANTNGTNGATALTVNGIVRWDGTRWYAYGAGFGVFGVVRAIALAPDGSLIAGGVSDPQYGGPAQNIARWNGTTWVPIGTGLTGDVEAIAVMPNGDIIVAAYALSVNGVTMNGVARWDGTAWRSMDGGLLGQTGAAARVVSLTVAPSGDLFAGGSMAFTTTGVPVRGVARWDGVAWRALGSGIGNAGGASTMTTLPDGSLIVGGNVPTAGGIPVNNLAKWNGVVDTDGDSLPDDWECNGVPYRKSDNTLGRVALPGANRLRKDIFVEVDVMQGAPFSAAALAEVRAAFDVAPVAAPAGVAGGLPGITLHTEVQEQLPFVSSFHADQLAAYRLQNFGSSADRASPDSAAILEAKGKAYRYAVIANRMTYQGSGHLLGKATGIPATTFGVALGGLAWPAPEIERQFGVTFMHELGHALGLCHGGGDHRNYKPNCVSVMNYNFTHVYALAGPLPVPLALDYSRERMLHLNEACLNEFAGISASGYYAGTLVPFARAGALFTRQVERALIGAGAVDWNDDGALSGCVTEDVTWFPSGHPLEGQASPNERLDGFDDWQNLTYRVPALSSVVLTCAGDALVCELTEELAEWQRVNIPPPAPAGPVCDSLDFNRDTLTPDSGDLDDFVAVLSGGPSACSTFPTPGCNDVDFNNDGLSPDSLDLEAFLSRLSGGPCL